MNKYRPFFVLLVLLCISCSACSRPRYYGDQADFRRQSEDERTHESIVREQKEIIRRQEEEIRRQDLEIEDMRRQKFHNDSLRRFER